MMWLYFVVFCPKWDPTWFLFFFFNDTAPTEISPLSLRDALPISAVSALTINDNGFILRVLPGDPARISIEPPLEFYQIDNQVRAGAARRIRVEREPGSRQLRIDRKSTRLNSSHSQISYAVFCLKK